MRMPKKGDRLKIILSCGVVEDGVVEVWAEDDERGITWSVLKHPELNMELHLQNYWIAGFKFIDPPKKAVAPKIIKEIEDDVQLDNPVINLGLRLKKIAELKEERTKAVKEQVKNHLKRKDIGGVQEVNYVMPSFKKRS